MLILKIVLLAPPIQDFYDTDIRHFPLGLLYLSSTLKQHYPEISVTILDFHHKSGKKTVPLPKVMTKLKPFYSINDHSPFSTFHHYYHFGADFELIANSVAKLSPDLIGISSMFTPYYFEVEEIAKQLRQKLPVSKIVIGGAHASAMPNHILENKFIDYVIIGEGEQPIIELVEHLNGSRKIQDVASLGYKKDNKIVFNPKSNYPIDKIPTPICDNFNYDSYKLKSKPIGMIQTSRGCPYKCSFCTTHEIFGRKFQQRNLVSIIEEMKFLYQKGVRIFDFEDDNLTLKKEFIISFCKEIKKTFLNNDIELVAMNGVSYWHLDQDILVNMKEAGFANLNISLVSRENNDHLLRPNDTAKFIEITNLASMIGFNLTGYYILGLPNQTVKQMISSLDLLATLPILVGASPFYLLPKSKLATNIEFTNEKMIMARLTALANADKNIYTLFIMSRVINFLKALPITSNITLNEALNLPSTDKREEVGKSILKKYFSEGIFYYCTSIKPEVTLVPNREISLPILKHLGTSIKSVMTSRGHNIALPGNFT